MPPTFSVRTSEEVLLRVDRYCAAANINRTEFFRRGSIRELVFPTQHVFFDLAFRMRMLFGSGAGLTLVTRGGGAAVGARAADLTIDVKTESALQYWRLQTNESGEQEWTSDQVPDVSRMLDPYRLVARTFVTPSPLEPGLERHVATIEALSPDLELPAHGGRHVVRLGALDIPYGSGDMFQVSVDSLRDYAVITDADGRPVEL